MIDEIIIRLICGGLASYSQTIGTLLRTYWLAKTAENDLSIAPMNSTYSQFDKQLFDSVFSAVMLGGIVLSVSILIDIILSVGIPTVIMVSYNWVLT